MVVLSFKNKQKSPPEYGGHLKAQTNHLAGHRQHCCTRCSKTNRSDGRGTPTALALAKYKKAPQKSGGLTLY
jgi:hypothetical protein